MKVIYKSGLSTAILWVVFKLVLFTLGIADRTTEISVLVNILLLLTAISTGLYLQKKSEKEESNAMIDLKHAVSAGFIHVVLTSTFIFLYYSQINPDYYANKLKEKEIAIHQMVNDPVKLKSFRKEYPDAEVMSKEQIQQKLLQNNRKGGSIGFSTTLAVLSMLLLCTFYSILVTIIFRKLVFKN